MLSSEQQSSLQTKLLDEKKELEHHISLNHHFGLREDENFYNYVGELSTFDNHPADTATELFERGEFVVSAEVGPPKGIHIEHLLEEAKTEDTPEEVTFEN